MTDPLAEIVTLLQPRTLYSKVVRGAGRWQVRRTELEHPFYAAILSGSTRLAVDGQEPILLQEGDFVLVPSAYSFTMTSLEPTTAEDSACAPLLTPTGEFRVGDQDVPPDVELLGGHCTFDSPDAALLVSLLPQLVHVRGESRLTTLVQLVGEEARASRSARDVILARLLEVLFIEALRSSAAPVATPCFVSRLIDDRLATATKGMQDGPAQPPSMPSASPCLVRGLADERLAKAIRCMHESPAQSWTVAQLAKEAALSRSAFFERFSRTVGVAPMEYLLVWRMALAKNLLRREESSIAEVAQRVGYSSASTFSVAFTRHVGLPPTQYVRAQRESENQHATQDDTFVNASSPAEIKQGHA